LFCLEEAPWKGCFSFHESCIDDRLLFCHTAWKYFYQLTEGEEMDDEELASFLQTGPFRVTGECYVIADQAGPGYGNTVVQCFPIRCPDGTILRGDQVASLVSEALNAMRYRAAIFLEAE
jgi:hypothetical protein